MRSCTSLRVKEPTSEGEFHEAVNWAAREKLPVIFLIQNNKYAISVPVKDQTAGGSVYDMTDRVSRAQPVRGGRMRLRGCLQWRSRPFAARGTAKARA